MGQRVQSHLTRSGIDTRTVRELAVSLIVGVEGAFVVSRATHSVQPVEVVRASLNAAVRAAQEQSHGPPGDGEARRAARPGGQRRRPCQALPAGNGSVQEEPEVLVCPSSTRRVCRRREERWRGVVVGAMVGPGSASPAQPLAAAIPAPAAARVPAFTTSFLLLPGLNLKRTLRAHPPPVPMGAAGQVSCGPGGAQLTVTWWSTVPSNRYSRVLKGTVTGWVAPVTSVARARSV